MNKLAIVAVSLATAFSSVAPAQAFPMVRLSAPQASDVEPVANRRPPPRWHGGRGGGRNWNRNWSGNRNWHGRNWNGNGNWHARNWRGNRYWHGNRYYRGGYYGGPYWGPYYGGYYDNNDDIGWLFGGLAAGALIGGALAQPYYEVPAYGGGYYGGDAHTRWCYAHYRSYRASDNTYQPYNGPRRQCVSP